MNTPKSRLVRFLLAPAAVVGLIVTGFSVGAALAQDDSDRGAAAQAADPGTPGEIKGTNKNGQTYGTYGGTGSQQLADLPLPDLIQVVATNGLLGYVDRALLDELTGANVSSPAEAVAWNQAMDAATWDTKTLPVYLLDGITQIGEFVIDRSQGEDVVDP